MPIVYDPRVSSGLLGHLAGAITGSAVARRTSFLLDRLGEQVFARGITVRDDPHRPRGLRSKPFDGEGLPTAPRDIIADGVLTGWIMDSASARQLGLQPTGHATRGVGGPPGAGLTNLYLEAGPLSPEELIADIRLGVYVTELIGQGVNGVTGDYSRGASGFVIRDGQICEPVAEITVAGNLKDMFRELTPASDLVFRRAVDAPTVRIDGMMVAGA
jgi:PmbA protein